MKNIFARGGIEFLAVLLGISSSLWIDNNRKESEIVIERKEVNIVIGQEERVAFYKRLDFIWKC